ncbi:MAG: LLM class flavin-dependent oxidoreductase [Nitrososphaerota archaeon]|nr:LLM class flavin-dependent oxidoreductase [Nitrososphaerota archaeon]MDG6922796.1 LLM class flavin-dependent oxidoreductase [Nitrososphaerota archaeon]
MTESKLGIAFRSSVIQPGEIVKLTKIADQSRVTNIFVNESSADFDALEICSASLGVSKGLLVGSGVIRLLEHDETLLLKRLKTLQALSNNRFVLGVGTGSPGPNPGEKIDLMLQRLDSLRKNFGMSNFPKTFIAALKPGIAKKVAGFSNGILLNFCTPEHAGRVIAAYNRASSLPTEFACYLKLFYSRSEEAAKRLLVAEFGNYARLPQYRDMFRMDGVLDEAQSAPETLRKSGDVARSLLSISLVNPGKDELIEHISRYRKAGISLPCVYPYFSTNDDFEFRSRTIQTIVSSIV